jgi:predicted RNA binding protein YcfA (HicA-like mRNA interferase family)
VTSREVIQKLNERGCVFVRQNGSHKIYRSPCGKCQAPVADHPGDIPRGTLANIERQMAPCLGKKWLTGSR